MLGLITQSKLLRPWMQLSYGTQVSVAAIALQLPLKSNESFLMAEEPPLSCEEVKEAPTVTRTSKRMSSRIPRMIKTRLESDKRRIPLPKPMPALEEVQTSDQMVTLAKRLTTPKASSVGMKSNLPKLTAGRGAKRKAAAERGKSTTLEATATTLIETSEKGYRGNTLTGAKPNAAGPPGPVAGEKPAASVPIVRSTRTSRCRMKLAHPHSLASNGNAAAAPVVGSAGTAATSATAATAASSTARTTPTTYTNAKLTFKPRTCPEMRDEQPRYYMINRKCLTEPFICLGPILGKRGHSQEVEANCNQIWRFACSDQVEVSVPSELIIHYSPLMRDRQKNFNLVFGQPIQLETITSHTMNRLITWMKHHREDDFRRLKKELPSVANAGSDNCSWDENFLGDDIDLVLQVLLAANCLGIYPLVEHTMLYFIELIEQRNNVERICMKHITKTLSQLQNFHPLSSEKLEQLRLASQNADGCIWRAISLPF